MRATTTVTTTTTGAGAHRALAARRAVGGTSGRGIGATMRPVVGRVVTEVRRRRRRDGDGDDGDGDGDGARVGDAARRCRRGGWGWRRAREDGMIVNARLTRGLS